MKELESKIRVKGGVYAYHYSNGVTNIDGESFTDCTVEEAISRWRQDNCTIEGELEEFLGEFELDFDILNYLDSKDKEAIIDFIENYEIEEALDFLRHTLQDKGAFEADVIGYREAMDYLIENDVSLSESMEIAQDMGYEPINIGSELLASLLQSRAIENDYHEIEGELEDFFRELEEDFFRE